MNRPTVIAVLSLTILVYLLGSRIPVLDIDSAQYASMSREMLERGDFLHVYDEGRDYLDKPPFLFWVSAFSMKVFGQDNFAFRLPSLLFSILALYAVYRFARLYYNETIARLAALILATSQALFLITHDVRTDTILMSWVIIALWQLAEWFQRRKPLNMILGFAAIAGGMLTKGPIALIVPALAFGVHFIFRRELFKQVFRWQNIAGLFIIAVLLLPMTTGLYQQFDMHPEKTVNGKQGVSGVRFFYWTQSFGRITGESEWNNHASFFFLFQNMLWSFLPWIIFFTCGLFATVKELWQKKFKIAGSEEGITIGGFILAYVALGLSKYQLPHYIFVVFPLAAVITAVFLYNLLWENKYAGFKKILVPFHIVLLALMWFVPAALCFWAFPQIPFFYKLLSVLLPAGYLILLFAKKIRQRLLLLCFYTSTGINFILTGGFYPELLTYQGGSEAGKWVHDHKIEKEKFKAFRYPHFRSLHFYARNIVPQVTETSNIHTGDFVLTDSTGLDLLKQSGKQYTIKMEGDNFHVAMLNATFINPETREKAVKKYYIAEIK
jgi:4-amino-4-deoxy-L-arabinose transferase-like glycosyltransferase